MSSPTVFVGVLRAQLVVAGARSLKDRRRVVRSLRDRVRAQFHVACHEVGVADLAGGGRRTASARHTPLGRAALLVTTGGDDADVVAQVLDRIRGFLHDHALGLVSDVDVEVIPWGGPTWGESLWEDADV